MRHKLLLVVIGLLLVLRAHASAEMFCREQNGAVFVREECRKAETRLNATALGLVGSPGPKGEKGERGPRGRQGSLGERNATTSPTPEPSSAGDAQTRPLWWQVWILLGTAVVIGIYTIETSRLRREAQTQTELQLRPFVIFEPAEGNDFRVRNIGNNTALNVRVAPFRLAPPVSAAFPRSVAFLGKGEAALLPRRTATIEGESVPDDLFDILHPASELVREEAETLLLRPTITVEFENVQGQRYFVRESLLNGDLEILGSGPVATPARSTVRNAWQGLQLAWQQIQPLWPKLQSAWQQLKGRKRERVNIPTVNEEKEWVDGR
jgi:hypothetical protein